MTPSTRCKTGIVRRLTGEEGKCVIEDDKDGKHTYFDESEVRNVGNEEVSINVGSRVRYELGSRGVVAEVVFGREWWLQEHCRQSS